MLWKPDLHRWLPARCLSQCLCISGEGRVWQESGQHPLKMLTEGGTVNSLLLRWFAQQSNGCAQPWLVTDYGDASVRGC